MRLPITIIGSIIAISLLAVACDATGPTKDGAISTAAPPAQYRGDNTVTVTYTSDVEQECYGSGLGYMGGDTTVLGCNIQRITTTSDGHRIISNRNVLKNPCLTDPRSTACHELGHANGWPADHPHQ